MSYKNPIPSVDDERISQVYSLVFTFEDYVTQEEATRGINELIAENGGTIPSAWIKMGLPQKMRHALPQRQ